MSIHRDFLRLLDLMTSPMLTSDGFKWVIQSIDMLPDGPCEMFFYDWRSPRPGAVGTSGHDSFACMSVRCEQVGFVIRNETCSMGPQTRDANQALMNRFNKALRAIKE